MDAVIGIHIRVDSRCVRDDLPEVMVIARLQLFLDNDLALRVVLLGEYVDAEFPDAGFCLNK